MADEHVPPQLTAFGRFYRRSGLRPIVRQRRNALLYHLSRVALVSARSVSLPRALAFADRSADLVYAALPGVRRMTLEHLALALGDTHSAAAREDIARAAYRNTARIAVELAKLEDIRPYFDEYASVEGWEHFEAIRDRVGGAIVVTGHIGNFELLAAYFAHKGVSVAAGARRLDDPRLNRLLNDFRTGNGVQTILRSTWTLQSHASLPQGRRAQGRTWRAACPREPCLRALGRTLPLAGVGSLWREAWWRSLQVRALDAV